VHLPADARGAEAGEKIRVRVLRNADDLAYRNLLIQGIKGAGVRNHEDILTALLQLRREQLAQLIQTEDCDGLDDACSFGLERAKKILIHGGRTNVFVFALSPGVPIWMGRRFSVQSAVSGPSGTEYISQGIIDLVNKGRR
jgi:hypothetical protein